MSPLKYIKFSELPVTDQDRALAFYTQKLGLIAVTDTPYGPGMRWIELAIPGAETRVLFTQKNASGDGVEPKMIFVTDNIEAAYRHLSEQGVLFSQAPAQAPWDPLMTYALFQDSEGNNIMLGTR